MKPTLQKAIIYDDSCPMCRAYTQGFVKWGVLDAGNRIPFCSLDPGQAGRYLDVARSRHEIPLVDLANGQTLYGVDALVFLLGHRLPVVARLMRIPILRRLAGWLYAFVSYNRRVITATVPTPGGLDCAPGFRAGYRLAFIGFALAVGGLAAWAAGRTAGAYVPGVSGTGVLLAFSILGGVLVLLFLAGRNTAELAGQGAVLVLVGSVGLLPGLVLDAATGSASAVWLAGGLLLGGVLVGAEGRRRIRYLKARPGAAPARC